MGAIDVIKGNYIRELIERNEREDGRGPGEYRKVSVESGLFENAEGSAMVEIGNTKVLAGIKIDAEAPMRDSPEKGNFMVSFELLPLAYREYESGPPSPDAIELARVIDRGIRAGECINLEKLFIEEGKVWGVFADIYVLNYDGNLFDAGTIGAMAALLTARMPKYEDGSVIREGNLGKLEVINTCASSTFAKIGKTIVLDADANEEDFSDARLTITTDEKYIRAMQKGLGGSFYTSEAERLIDVSFEKSKELIKKVKEAASGD